MQTFVRIAIMRRALKVAANDCMKGFTRVSSVLNLQVRRYGEQAVVKQRSLLSQLTGGSVDLHKDDSTGIATITINHPERKNALSGKMMADLHDVVDDLESWKSGRGVLLQGAAGTFCSGGDLTLMKSLIEMQDGGINMSKFMQHTMTRLFQLPIISVAYLEGRALGGGAELAVSCDFRIMHTKAQIGFVQCALGLSPGWGGGTKLIDIVGRTTALKLLSSASLLSANDALDIGLIDKIVSTKEEALEYLTTYTQSSSSVQVLQAAKRVIVNGSSELSIEEKLRKENSIFGEIFGGPAQLKALSGNIKFSKQKS